jgi:protein SCO1/2
MMYTSCRSVCPRITADMAAVARLLPEADRRRVGFVMFSLDPGRDSPRALRNFAREHDLDPRRWRLFSAAEEDVRTLAAVLGVKSRPDEGGEIAHSAMIFVIDGRGVVRHRQVGLNQDPADLIAAVRAAR